MKEKKQVFKISKKMLLGVLLITTMFFSMVFTTTLVTHEYDIKKTRNLLFSLGQDVDPGQGNDGIVNIYVYPLSEKTDVTGSPYNCSEYKSYAHGDDTNGWQDGEELEGDVDPSYTWFICVEVQFSDKAYNTTSSDWDLTLVEAEMTSTDLSLTAETGEEGGDFFDQDGTSDAKLTFFWDNSDAGWSTTTGQNIDVDDLDIYYYT